ncbi:MAG: nitroreductase family protein, partial [Parvularculaceae bacterium]|nr:nitroreductase family protein [Parvularculaceae bacterium]
MTEPTPVADAIRRRNSTRAFRSDPVPEATLRSLLEAARWAPSGGNLQPWRIHVATGAARDRLVAGVKAAIAENPFASEAEIKVYPDQLWEPYRTRRYVLGEAMYERLGCPKEDKVARLQHLARNFEFFGAPVGLFFSLDRRFDKG